MMKIQINEVTFEEYIGWFEKYKNNNDIREVNFQNEVVKKLLCKLFEDLDIVDCSVKVPRTTKHNYLEYCGTYEDKRGEQKATTADLVIVKNWNWYNKDNEVDYRAVVEVKSPYLQPIYNKEYSEYSNSLKKELNRHLSATINEKVILTDAMKWEFYKKTEIVSPQNVFKIYDLVGRNWVWKENEKEFENLKSYLKEFLYDK